MKRITLFFLLLCIASALSLRGFAQTTGTSSTITWQFNTGASGQLAYYSPGTYDYFSSNWVEAGSNQVYNGKAVNYSDTLTIFHPAIVTGTGDSTDVNIISFNIRPKSGYKFTPTTIALDCGRFGTNGGAIKIAWKSSDGTITRIASNVKPNLVSTSTGVKPTHLSYDLSGLNLQEMTGDGSLLVYIYALAVAKTIGLGNIAVTGNITGSYVPLPQYTLSIAASPTLGGTVSCSPYSSSAFDEGSVLTLTATRNFGYQFSHWTSNGTDTISKSTVYTFTITKNTNAYAVFKPINTYALNLKTQGGANLYMVQVSPAGTVVSGKTMYETGTNVTLTAKSHSLFTFTNWLSGETSASKTLIMNQNQDVTAVYSVPSYIVGWDFKSTTTITSKIADCYVSTENEGFFNLYNLDRSIASGSYKDNLFSSGLTGVLMNTPAATIRKIRSFQTSFSTAGFKNIKVSAQLALTQQAFSTFKMFYSVNGAEFKPVDTLTFSTTEYNTVWKESSATLPTDAQNAERVVVRWVPDTTSTVYGTSTSVDGSVISNIFVYADTLGIQDITPPSLISINPASGTIVAPINGSVVVSFNEKVKAGSSTVTLNGVALTPVVSNKLVSFAYEKLVNSTSYTLVIPEGAITDLAGNLCASASISFTTVSRSHPEKKLFDAVVATDGSGDYTTVLAAIEAAPTARTSPWLIYIKNGKYTGHHDIPSTKPFIHLIGQRRDSVIISDKRLSGGDNAYPVLTGATMVVNSSDCYFEDLTFENSEGYDNLAGPQALAFYGVGKHITINNCWLRSYQDTYLSGDLQYFRNSKIEGAVDFIYGAGDVFFDKCTITCNRASGGYIVAPNHKASTLWGYVFNNCTIDASPRTPSVSIYYGRPWHEAPKTVYLNTTLKVTIYPEGWYKTMGGLPAIWADYGTVDSLGNLLDLSQRISKYYYLSGTDTIWGTAKNKLTDAEAATYTYENVMLRSGDTWEPRGMTEAPEKPSNLSYKNAVVKWDTVPYSRLYIVIRNDKVLGFTTDNQYSDTTAIVGQTYAYEVQAVSGFGALSSKASTSVVAVSPTIKLKQTVSISPVPAKTYGDAPFTLSSTVSPSNYNVVYSVVSGPASVSSNTVTITGAGQVTIKATQEGDDTYKSAYSTVTFTVDKAKTSINWSNPSAITYGTTLSSAQLNALISGSTGAVSYSPALGSKLSAGTQNLTVNVEADTNYEAASLTLNILVNKAIPEISWATPSTITYGTALDNNQLNASITGSTGNLSYVPALGSVLSVGVKTITVNVEADANYEAASKTVNILVNKALTSISWNDPDAITYGTSLTANQLNAVVSGSLGTVTYSPALGSSLSAGIQTLRIDVAADANYEAASKTVSILVNKASSSILWNTPAAIVYGTELSSNQLNATVSGSSGAVSYTVNTGTKLSAGTYNITVNVAADANYEATSKTVVLVVNKAIPVISWETPAAIVAGTALSASQLNATATGTTATASYTPAIGTVLEAGTNTLSVRYAADENYEAASKSVTIVVTARTSVKAKLETDINIFPNPVNNGNVRISGLKTATRLSVTSINGSIILTKNLTTATADIDISNMPNGLLLFRFETSDDTFVKQVIKQ